MTSALIFDGDCGFCTSAAHWAERGFGHDERAIAWQFLGESGLAALGLTLEQASQAAWWVEESGQRARGHRAIGKALAAGGGWRRVLGVVILLPPISPLAGGIYRLVVRFRYRLPGGTPACRLAKPHESSSS